MLDQKCNPTHKNTDPYKSRIILVKNNLFLLVLHLHAVVELEGGVGARVCSRSEMASVAVSPRKVQTHRNSNTYKYSSNFQTAVAMCVKLWLLHSYCGGGLD
jgi:hypothetical protein